jgi:hypothetical protein
MYSVLNAERPSVLSQLMYVMNSSNAKNDVEIAKRVVSLMHELQTFESEE